MVKLSKETFVDEKFTKSISQKTIQQLNKISEYWEDKNTISLLDKNLKILEQNAIKTILKKSDVAIDVGCGDGRSTCEYSKFVKKIIGIDNSSRMINKAKRYADNNYPNLTFLKKNILDLKYINQKFDVAITDRVITNLPTWKLQQQAILDIHSILKNNGRYIMIENFSDGYNKMNKFRKLVGLNTIPKHWHNTYLDKTKLFSFITSNFKIIKQFNFNVYCFLSRIYVPMFASFTGYGKNARSDLIFKKSDVAARKIFETLNTELNLLNNEFFGPINGLLLVKIK